jgi:hypothetical protein
MGKGPTRRQGPGKSKGDLLAIRRANRAAARHAGLLGTSRYTMVSQVHDTSPEEVDWLAEAQDELAQDELAEEELAEEELALDAGDDWDTW